jgi:hypothetical protein
VVRAATNKRAEQMPTPRKSKRQMAPGTAPVHETA